MISSQVFKFCARPVCCLQISIALGHVILHHNAGDFHGDLGHNRLMKSKKRSLNYGGDINALLQRKVYPANFCYAAAMFSGVLF